MRRNPMRFILLACCLTSSLSSQAQSLRGVSVIVVPAEADAAGLRLRLQSGASFEALAIAYSTDSSAARGGYLGKLDPRGLKPEFQTALEGLQPGAVSPVARTGSTFALLKWTSPAEERWRDRQEAALSTLQQGRFEDAASLFQETLKQAESLPGNPVFVAESTNGLAQAYHYQGNYALAEPLARRAFAILEQTAGRSQQAILPSLTNLAAITRALGKFEEAERLYGRIIAVRWGVPGPGGDGADQVLESFADVLTYARTRDPRLVEALKEYWRSIDSSLLNNDLYVAMRDRLLALHLVEEAELLMQRAIRRNPGSRYLQYRLGELYATWGKYEKGIKAFEGALLKAHPDPEMERTQQARIYERIGEMNFLMVRFDVAFKALTAAVEINPGSASARRLLAALHARRNKLDEAAAEYRRAISVDPAHADAHDGLAQVHLTAGRYSEAALSADRALAINPGLQSSRYVRAMALIRDGRETDGRAALDDYERREAVKQESQSREDDVAALDRASSGMLGEQLEQDAFALLQSAVRQYPQSVELQLKLALLQSRLGRHKEAVETLEGMVRLKLDDFLVHRQLAQEYELLGDAGERQRQRVIYLQRYDAALQGSEYR